MNILIVGDPHFKLNNVVDCQDMASQIVQIAKDKQPDMIVVLGDTLDRHDVINMIPLCQSVDFLKQLQDISKVYLIIGNHDRRNNKIYMTEEHPFTALKYWNNIDIIDTIKYIIFYKNNKEYYFTMVPYVETGLFREALKLVDYKKSHCLFCHQEFKDAQMGAFKSVHGEIWQEDDPYVISGHIHDYQKLQNNILYIGTPIQHSFGDNPKKCIVMLHLDDKINHHDECQYEKIKLNIKVKKIIHLKYEEVAKYKLDENINAKIIITGTLTENKTLMKSPKIIKWKKTAVVVFRDIPTETPIKENYVRESFTSLLYNSIKNDKNLISTYTEIFG